MNWNPSFQQLNYQAYRFFSFNSTLYLLFKGGYLLATSLLIVGFVWSYSQTPSTRQATYAPVMYFMSVTFFTELIGDDN